ncbi:hypothetical protein BDV41DRAFT_490281 [Aspergillus transmontanensis]|uniref:mannosyl-oligosaccharide 1,2-alpha-mannosidase n=1 Tax=Aspergillus transmontanensis TaxID=1034304 RepID=A0A5N6WA62_9EURO|nr:hypothetical protein BDV41DRAFT_490281 [Aspergillus transmontanensis]
MYRVTNDPGYRKWGWEIFKAFKKHTVVKDGEGCTSLHDATKLSTPQCDNMESFWLVRSSDIYRPCSKLGGTNSLTQCRPRS